MVVFINSNKNSISSKEINYSSLCLTIANNFGTSIIVLVALFKVVSTFKLFFIILVIDINLRFNALRRDN